MSGKSCVGCKFLYTVGTGYSNWTHLDDEVNCAKDRNQNLPADEPDDWDEANDNWPMTKNARCELYSPGVKVALDVEGADGPADHTCDEEAITAICAHSGREPHGDA